MATVLRHIRYIAGALALACMIMIAAPAGAQQINPTADAVKEQQLLEQLNRISGRCTLPDQKACTIEQPAGRDWRYFHQVTLHFIGGIAILGIFALLVLFYLVRGTVRVEQGRSGRLMARFNVFERMVHWMTAACFIILALSGLNVTFGRELILPWMGPEAFATMTQWGKYAHNFLSFPFTLGVVLTFLMWIGSNIPTRVDVEWIKQGGGMVGHKHPPAGRFNAGQKLIYWVVVLGGGLVAASGYLLMFPFYGTNIFDMQIAQVVHGVVAVLFVAAMLVHIYMGTLGEEGAFEGMWDGTVDENWAKQHHRVWYEQEAAKGQVGAPPPAGRMQPAE